MTVPADHPAVSTSRLKALRFEEALETALKRHDPCEYASAAAHKLHSVLERKVKIGVWRPHDLIHSIEACCAYHRRGRSHPVTRNSLAKVMNVYHEHSDPVVMHLLTEEQKLYMALRVMAAQQFPFQYRPHYSDFARVYAIFVRNHPLPQTDQAFEAKFGFRFRVWMEVCFAIIALTQDRRPPVFQPSQLLPLDRWTKSEIQAFVSLSSRKPEQICDQYRTEREQLDKPFLSRLLRSGFIERPIMTCADDWYLVPHDGLLFRHAGEGLLRLCRDLETSQFGNEIGDSFERYVFGVLKHIKCETILRAKQIEQVVSGKSCDFVVVQDDCFLLVECKAVSVVARLLTEKVLQRDTSTRRISEAAKQLLSTATAIMNGSLAGLVGQDNKPIVGVIVTYGDVVMVNSPWYRSEIIRPSLRERGIDSARLDAVFEYPLQILSIKVLEQFVTAANKHGPTGAALIEQKEKENYVATGDWDTYLLNLLEGTPFSETAMPNEAMEEFFTEVIGEAAENED